MFYSGIYIKRWGIISFFLTIISTSLLAQSSSPISYAEALKIALHNNPRIGSSKTSIEAAYGQVKQANSLRWPQLSFEFNGASSDNPLAVFGYKLSQGNASFADFGAQQYTGPSTLYTKPNALNHPGYYSNLDTAFKLTVPIYAGGKIQAERANAEALLQAAQHGNQHAQNQLAYQLFEAYEGELAAEELISIAKDHLAHANTFLKKATVLHNQSITLESDVLMAKSYQSSAALAVSNATVQEQNQLDLFRTLLGVPNSKWTPNHHVNWQKNTFNMQSLTQNALRNNAEVHATESLIKAEKANIAAAQSAYKPQVNLQLRQDWNGETFGAGLASNIVALGVNWTLFSAGDRAGAVQKAQANAKKSTFELDEQRNQLRLSIRQLKRSESQAQREYLAHHQMEQEEAKVVHKLQKRFGRGLTPLGGLLESEMKLTQSQAQEVQALYMQRITKAHLLILTNQLVPTQTK